MEKIAMILFAALALLVSLCGSVIIGLLFRKFGDGWEFRREYKEEENKKLVKEAPNEP